MFGNSEELVFTLSVVPAMFFGIQEGRNASILFSFAGFTLLRDENCSNVSGIMWKESII